MKRIISLFVVAILLMGTCVVSVAGYSDHITRRVPCNCGGLCVLACDKDFTLEDQATHSYDFFSKTCTKNYYYARYTAYICEICATEWPIFGVDDTYHLCYIEHENCGQEDEYWCLQGQYM